MVRGTAWSYLPQVTPGKHRAREPSLTSLPKPILHFLTLVCLYGWGKQSHRPNRRTSNGRMTNRDRGVPVAYSGVSTVSGVHNKFATKDRGDFRWRPHDRKYETKRLRTFSLMGFIVKVSGELGSTNVPVVLVIKLCNGSLA